MCRHVCYQIFFAEAKLVEKQNVEMYAFKFKNITNEYFILLSYSVRFVLFVIFTIISV